MNRGAAGIGSATVVLMFTVLCMAIFALISHTSAQNGMALANAEARLVRGYYEADALALGIAEELAANPQDTRIVDGVAEFTCGITEQKELYVKLAMRAGSYDVLAWRMRDTGQWQPEGGMAVWPGTQTF
jgi:hypothetical protein